MALHGAANSAAQVDTRKVEMAVMKPWIAKKVSDLLGFEDDIVIEYVNGLLEDPENPVSAVLTRVLRWTDCTSKVIDAKKMQILLTGFLEAKTPEFMRALWSLLLSAQASPLKVPAELLEQKKQEMRAREQAEAVKRRSDEARPPPPQSRFGDRPQRGGRGGRGGQSGRGGGFRGDKSSREHDKPPVRAYDDDADPSRRIPRDYYDDRRRDRSRSPDVSLPSCLDEIIKLCAQWGFATASKKIVLSGRQAASATRTRRRRA